jgi:hypothetical protein
LPDAASPARATPAPRARQIEDWLLIACGLSWGAGLIHVKAAVDHLDEYVLYSVFFECLAVFQLVWGVVLYRSPSRRLMLAGAATSLGVVLLWIASRTTGLPIGPTPWSPEPVGAIDVIASADEAVLALLVLVQLRSWDTRALVRASRYLVIAAGLVLILVSCLSVTGAGHAH